MSTLKVNEVRHLSNSGTANIVLESNANTNLQTTGTKALSVDGTLTVTGLSTLNGDTTVGNATTDTLSLISTVSGFNNFSGFTGEIRMYAGNAAGNSPPSGWLYCNGNSIALDTTTSNESWESSSSAANHQSSTYQALFNLLKASNDWGNASSAVWGTNKIKLPDFRSRAPVGVGTGASNAIGTGSDSATLIVRALGDTTGAENHILTTAQIPAHLHGASSVTASTGVTASLAAITATQPTHTHTLAHTHAVDPPNTTTGAGTAHNHINGDFDKLMRVRDPLGGTAAHVDTLGAGQADLEYTGTILPESSHTHDVNIASFTSGAASATTTSASGNDTITVNSPATTISDSGHSHTVTTTNTGGGLLHTNISPIISVNFIIKV